MVTVSADHVGTTATLTAAWLAHGADRTLRVAVATWVRRREKVERWESLMTELLRLLNKITASFVLFPREKGKTNDFLPRTDLLFLAGYFQHMFGNSFFLFVQCSRKC